MEVIFVPEDPRSSSFLVFWNQFQTRQIRKHCYCLSVEQERDVSEGEGGMDWVIRFAKITRLFFEENNLLGRQLIIDDEPSPPVIKEIPVNDTSVRVSVHEDGSCTVSFSGNDYY